MPKQILNTTSVRIRTDLKKAIQAYASKNKLTMTKVMIEIFEDYITKNNIPFEKQVWNKEVRKQLVGKK
jgi:antitoxin component of RelBE/YafQ-DinJ toxin-antitoxin module